MQTITLARPTDVADVADLSGTGTVIIAGGTDLMQLMKDEVETPARLIDIAGLPLDRVRIEPDGLHLGALARMADVAAHPAVRADYTMIAEALALSASPQIRNMGTMGGNLLQRTRCGYFRDTGFACNKRSPGSGCPAIRGENRMLGILGVSDRCIATHPSDMPVALAALDAQVETAHGRDTRRIPLAEFYRLPGDTPQVETTLAPGELITGIFVPGGPVARRSRYLKIRDRASFEFALVSVAVGLDMDNGRIREARIAMGGVGPRPWRLPAVEDLLRGRPPTRQTFEAAAARAADGARPATQNGFKATLMPRAIVRALELTVA